MRRRPQPTMPPTGGAPAHAMTPTIQARRDVVTVLVCAPFDAWYDQWMLQVDNDAVDVDGVDFFDDAVRLFEPAALGMALAALRAHLDAHAATYAAAGVTLLVEPRIAQADQIVQLLGVFETMHEDGAGRREDGELSFVETVAHDALRVPAYRAAASPFPAAVFAPGDPFFSAVDDSALLSDATLDAVRAHPEQYALVDLQVTTIYARLLLRGPAGDDAAEQALTA
jgi:hypothetical protein